MDCAELSCTEGRGARKLPRYSHFSCPETASFVDGNSPRRRSGDHVNRPNRATRFRHFGDHREPYGYVRFDFPFSNSLSVSASALHLCSPISEMGSDSYVMMAFQGGAAKSTRDTNSLTNPAQHKGAPADPRDTYGKHAKRGHLNGRASHGWTFGKVMMAFQRDTPKSTGNTNSVTNPAQYKDAPADPHGAHGKHAKHGHGGRAGHTWAFGRAKIEATMGTYHWGDDDAEQLEYGWVC